MKKKEHWTGKGYKKGREGREGIFHYKWQVCQSEIHDIPQTWRSYVLWHGHKGRPGWRRGEIHEGSESCWKSTALRVAQCWWWELGSNEWHRGCTEVPIHRPSRPLCVSRMTIFSQERLDQNNLFDIFVWVRV